MIPTTPRFQYGDTPDAARQLFENSHALNISITRPLRGLGALLVYELHGGFQESDGDLTAIASQLIRAFSQLPARGGSDDDSDD